MAKEIYDAIRFPVTGEELMKFNTYVNTGNFDVFDIKLSEHFMLSEFVKTKYYQKYNYFPRLQVFHNIKKGVDFVLEPLRQFMRKPIIITSGYRTLVTNAAVGGKPSSQHTKGCAADIRLTPYASAGDFRLMREHIQKSLPFDQMLTSEKGCWLHVSWTYNDYCAEGRRQMIIGYYD